MATAYEFEQVAKKIADSFDGINEKAEESEGFWAKFFKIIDVASKIKDTIDLIKMAITGLTAAFGGLAGASEAAGVGEVAGGALLAIEPVGDLVLLVGALVFVIKKLSEANDDASDNMQHTTKQFDETGKAADSAKLSVDSLNESFAKINPPELNGQGLETTRGEMMLNSGQNYSDDIPQAPAIPPPINQDEIDMEYDFEQKTKDFYALTKRLNPPENGNIHVGVQAVSANSNDSDDTSQINAASSAYVNLAQKTDQANAATKNFAITQQDLVQLLSQTVSKVSNDIGAGIVKMAQKTASAADVFKGILKDLTDSISQFLKQKADAFIEMGIADIAAGAVMLTTGNPYGAQVEADGLGELAAGTGLSVAAGAISAIKMAQGGIVSGSTFANIGEYAGANHNPEVVAPLDKLQKLMGNNTGMPSTIQMYARGDSLQATIDRRNNNNGFINGF